MRSSHMIEKCFVFLRGHPIDLSLFFRNDYKIYAKTTNEHSRIYIPNHVCQRGASHSTPKQAARSRITDSDIAYIHKTRLRKNNTSRINSLDSKKGSRHHYQSRCQVLQVTKKRSQKTEATGSTLHSVYAFDSTPDVFQSIVPQHHGRYLQCAGCVDFDRRSSKPFTQARPTLRNIHKRHATLPHGL